LRTYLLALRRCSRADQDHSEYLPDHGPVGAGEPEPVTKDTHFLVASTTKSMSSLLVATFVDQGKLGWDQPVVDAWPGFRAPTQELTRTLRVRDLLGMASGIGEPGAFQLSQGYPTVSQLLNNFATLPVTNPPNEVFFYNNTVYAVGGYLPLLAEKVADGDLQSSYRAIMHERVYGPAGMTTARIADDPRGVVTGYAAGHGLTLGGSVARLPYAPVGSYAPVGGTLASLDDMAAYVRLQLRNGLSVSGAPVVSAANLTETHTPHIPVPVSKELDPDTISAGYGLGWTSQRYSDGNSLVWHNGGIDGFTTFIGFIPEQNLGLIVLNNINPEPTGTYFYLYVLNLILNAQLGLNIGVPAKIDELNTATITALKSQDAKSSPVDPGAVAPYLGYYQDGYQLEGGTSGTQIVLGPRLLPLASMPDGSYIMTGGLLVGSSVRLYRGPDGTPQMDLVDLDQTVQRTVGF
jgi:CubicO group peptidase (beta-lactamase class C family)